MHGFDSSTVRSRYDYYYSISSPSLSQARNYYDKQASLFGEPVAPLLPAPMQRSPSVQPIANPLTPFTTHVSSSISSADTRTNFATSDVHSSLIENFDNHLYESIRKNILDKHNNNEAHKNDLSKHKIWTQHSSSSTTSPPQQGSDDNYSEDVGKRAATSFDNYKPCENGDVLTNKFRISSAHGDMRSFHQISTESTSSSDNNNNKKPVTVTISKSSSTKPSNAKKPPRVPFLSKRNKTMSSIAINSASTSSSSKLNHTVSHVVLKNTKPPARKTKDCKKDVPLMVKSKSDLMSLNSYPEAFTIITSPRRSPSAGYCESKRRKIGGRSNNDDDDDEMMEYEWVKPPAAKLYEAAQAADSVDNIEDPPFVVDIFGQHVSRPTTPILTDKVMVGSSHRVSAGTFNTHKKLAFAIVNDYKNRRTRLLQHRHSEDNMNLDGRFSPYTRYCLQRELSAPALNRLESFESEDNGEFYYYFEDDGDEESGRKTSIGFVHKKNRLTSSMSNLAKRRPQSELQMNMKTGPKFVSTPNFLKINKRAVIQSQPMEKINPRFILHRSLKGVLKVFNNTNIQKKTFSLDNMDIFLPNGKVDPNLLTTMPINNEEKISEKLSKQQLKLQKKKEKVLRRRRLSPIAGTPNKETEFQRKRREEKELKTPKKKKLDTPMAKLEERLKKDKFGRLITPKKAALPDFRKSAKSAGKKKKGDVTFDEEESRAKEDDERDQKAINFMQQLQAKNILGRTLKARMDAKKPAPLTRQPSKQSIESIMQDKPAPLKKKSSYTSLKSLTSSIRTIGSVKTNRSSASQDDEEAEAGDEITKLKNLKEAKKDTKSKIKGGIKILSLGRASSGSSSKSQKESAPPPSRTASKTSILSHSSVSKAPMDVDGKADTPSRKSDVIRAPSATSVMSMTTAAITANPLNTTLTITNQLATQGAEFLEKKHHAGGDDVSMAPSVVNPAVASHPDVDKISMASQQTISSQKTSMSKAGSRKTSAKIKKGGSSDSESRKGSAGQKSKSGSFLGAIVHAHHAVRKLARKHSPESIKSEKSDATQITIGPGAGADNKDIGPIAGKILEHSQRSLENVQKTVDKATHEIHQSINEKLSDLKTLEKKLSKSNLLEHDANNNDVEKKSTKGLSRHSTKIDMKTDTSTSLTTGTTTATDKSNNNNNNNNNSLKQSTMLDKDRISVNAISVAPDGDDDNNDDSRSMARPDLQHQDSDASNQMNSSTR
ncbi:hypothetical protein ACKWTF_013188 [Chironomus riparius]